MMKFTRFFAIFMAMGMASLVGATSYAQETPAPTGGTGEAAGTADAAAEIFGKKENVSIKHTQNYKSCFKFKDQTIGGGMYIDCFPYQPYIGGGPFVIFKMEYTEPVLVVEAVTEPGTSGIDDVPGQSGVETLMGGMSASGRSTSYGGAERPAMPTAAHQPQAYFDAHVWGLGPMGRFAATKRSGMDIPPAKKLEAAQSLACDIADSYIGYWPMAIKRDILLQILAQAPQLTVAYLFDWGFSWFSGLGGLMDLASGFSSMGDMGSAMGGLGNMGGAMGGAMGNMGGAMGSLTGAMGGMGGAMGSMGGMMGGAMGSLGSMGSAFGGAMGGLGSLTGSVGGFMGGFGNIMGGVQNVMSVGQGGPGGMAANMMSNFVGDSGNQSMFIVAGAAIALGYAMNSDDKEYVCKTKQQIDRGVEGTNNMVQQTSAPQSQQLLQPAAFLPPGYPTQKSYDTCHLTGNGYYMDADGTPHFANCHPEERALLLNCSRRTASLLKKEEVSRHVNVAYAQIPLADHTVDSCTAGKGIQFTDNGDTFRVVRVSRCDNRLSNMQQNGYFIACDNKSKTYNSCGRSFTGEAKYDPMRGSELQSTLANAGLDTRSKGLEGAFSVCAFPEGTKTVDQLKDYNAGLQEFAQTAATFAATGMTEAQKEINRKAEEMDAQCENGRSKNNSGGGSALGNVGTAIAGAVVAQTAMSFLGKVGGSLSGAMGGAGGGMMGVFGSGTSHMMGNMLSQVPGASAVTGITDQMSGAMSGAMGGMTNALGGMAGVGNAAGALTNLNSSVSTYMNAYNMLAGGGLGQIANNLDDVFKITNEVFPVFLSEANESDWRDDRKASRQMSLNPLGMMGSGLKAMGCEIAGMASGVTDMVGMGRVFDKSLQDVCLAWGPVQPLTGFIPTSGNDFPAAALAKWRGYQRAKVFLAKKKMEQDMWKFNLDYPHYSRCFDIGAPSTRWESRGLALKEEVMPGIAGDIINSATDMFSGFAGAGGLTDFGKMAEGLQGGLKVEEGKFISTYWKKTGCLTTACAIDGQVLKFKQQK